MDNTDMEQTATPETPGVNLNTRDITPDEHVNNLQTPPLRSCDHTVIVNLTQENVPVTNNSLPSTSQEGQGQLTTSTSTTNGNVESPGGRATGFLKRAAESRLKKSNKLVKADGDGCDGPLYPKQEGSLILYNPEEDAYDEITNRNGFVPVVVHPEIVHGKPADANNSEPKLPLKQTQIDGLKFLWKCLMENKGGILAHEPGLGKTLICITLILTAFGQKDKSRGKSSQSIKKVIILAPKNGVPVWKDEIEKWCPNDIRVTPKIILSCQRNGFTVVEDFGKDDSKILILSYETFKKYNPEFSDYPKNTVDLVICDEAHLLKNEMAKRTETLGNFKGGKLWIGVTGTPYQNNLIEFCNLITFFRHDALPTNYKVNYCAPIMNYLRKNKELNDELHDRLKEIKEKARPVLDYKANPIEVDKHEVLVCCALAGSIQTSSSALTPEDEARMMQHKLYEELCSETGMKGLQFYTKLDLLTKVCIHPKLAYQSFNERPELVIASKLYDTLWPVSEIECTGHILNLMSAKINLLFNMLSSILESHEGEKIVIVSYSKETLKLVEELCQHPDYKYTYVSYDGDTKSKKREEILKGFENDDKIQLLLLSCKSGGTALTLTRANHMFLLDPDWNPANDKQALGRIYRVGQQRTVYIYRFVCTGTLEEAKFLTQLTKDEIATFFRESNEEDKKMVLPNGEADLLTYHLPTRSYIKDMLSQVNDDPLEYREFAQVFSNSLQYTDASQVPAELHVLRDNWDQLVTYAFHSIKRHSRDTDMEHILQDMARTPANGDE